MAQADLSMEASASQNLPEKINLSVGEKNFTAEKADIEKWVHEKTELIQNKAYRSEIEFADPCVINKSLLCRVSVPYQNYNHSQKISHHEPDENAIGLFIKDLAGKFNREPADAKLKMENGRVSAFSLSSPGVRLDEKKSVDEIIKHLTGPATDASHLKLSYDNIEPAVSMDSIDNLGITNLLGEGRSNFAGSPRNRVYNIKVATRRFDGLLIKPNEEFSFVQHLGEVDGEHGYLPELVIKNNKTELEYGGGICQVSTTTFRAAINSGLKITMRRNHAYPVGYYNPQGMDATVYVPMPDLRFRNDTPGHILIEIKIEGTQLIINFYGSSDGRKVNVIGPKITERNPDGSMKTVFTQEVLDKDGNILRQDVFKSAYDSPSKYPHPAANDELLRKKPSDWSDREWRTYKKANGI